MNITDTITAFVQAIGLVIYFEPIEEKTFLPGLLIRHGALVIDKDKLLYPGDILHEAGHLAVMPPRVREKMNGDLDMDPIHHGGEMAAMAWSYAACIHLGIDPLVVFHEDGYKGGGKHLAENYQKGSLMGIPLLEWQQMTVHSNIRNQNKDGELLFPHMKRWLCEVDNYIK